jgi:hypothetical protein
MSIRFHQKEAPFSFGGCIATYTEQVGAHEIKGFPFENAGLVVWSAWTVIHVEQSYDKVDGTFQEPKSAAGKRTVPIPEQLCDILDEHLLDSTAPRV